MSFLTALFRKPPNFEDIEYFVRALLTRPGDIPGILRREAARRRAGHQDLPEDLDGLRCLTAGWEAALRAGMFRAPVGAGGGLTLLEPIEDPHAAITLLQDASALHIEGPVRSRALAAISLEAARLSAQVTADDPEGLREARMALIGEADLSPALRAALKGLIVEPPT